MARDGTRKMDGVIYYSVSDKKLFKDFKWESDRISFAFWNDLPDYSENDALEQDKPAIKETVESCWDWVRWDLELRQRQTTEEGTVPELFKR